MKKVYEANVKPAKVLYGLQDILLLYNNSIAVSH